LRVIDMPGHDLLEVRGGGGEFLIPMRREFVAWIDLERGEIRLADRADLLEAQKREATPPFEGAAEAGSPMGASPEGAGRKGGLAPQARRGKMRPDHSSESTS
jgi:hypothetical protein